MGGPSEREYGEKLNKVKEKLSKKAKDIKDEFAKIEKMKVELLKKTEEMRHNADHEIDKIDRDITKSKDLAPESQKRLHSEIAILRSEIREEYFKVKTQIAEAMVPK